MRFPGSGSRALRRQRRRRAVRARRDPHRPVVGPPLPVLHRSPGRGSGGRPNRGRPPPESLGYELMRLAAPRVTVVVNAQSAAALSVSWPLGLRISEPSTVLESAPVAGSTVPSTRLYALPSMVAAVIAPS